MKNISKLTDRELYLLARDPSTPRIAKVRIAKRLTGTRIREHQSGFQLIGGSASLAGVVPSVRAAEDALLEQL